MAEDSSTFCGVGVSQGHALHSQRGVTVHFDCRIQAVSCEHIEDQAQTPVVNNITKQKRRLTGNSGSRMSIQGLHLHVRVIFHCPHSLVNNYYPNASRFSLTLLLNNARNLRKC